MINVITAISGAEVAGATRPEVNIARETFGLEASPDLGTIGSIRGTDAVPANVQAVTGPSFSDVVGDMLGKASALGHVAGAKSEAFANGAYDDIHGTMIAGKEAEISMRLVGTIRNRLLDAFHEIWRTSV